MLKGMRDYIFENDFRLNLLKGKLNIVNYTNIDHFDDEKIIIRYTGGIISIKGENLTISKLLTDEILISGNIKNIDLKW